MEIGKYKFDRFDDPNKSFAAKVTIRRNGQLGFNDGARNSYRLKNFQYAVLFYDQENEAVGIMLTNNGEEAGAIKLSAGEQNTYISAKGFLDRHKINYANMKKRNRYELKKIEDMLVFELKEPITSAGGGE